jgi:hypothetical protein
MTCPLCNGKSVGKVGVKHYFCRDCYVEFIVHGDRVQVYEVEDDGSLVALAEVALLT